MLDKIIFLIKHQKELVEDQLRKKYKGRKHPKTTYKETTKEEDSTVDSSNVTVEESDILSAMRVEADETLLEQLDSLKLIMMDKDATVEEKNQAFDKMKELNINKAEEKELEKKIEETYKLKTFIKRDGDKIKVVVNSDKHDTQLANNIMRSIQENYENKMYITVQFK